MYHWNKYTGICTYISKVVDDAFRAINKENDAKMVIIITGNTKDDVACIVMLRSKAHLALYNRVGYRLARNFKKNFGLDIKFFPSIKGFMESSNTTDLENNGEYGMILYAQEEDKKCPIDPNHTVSYIETKTLGDFTLSIFPWSETSLYANVLYPGYEYDFFKDGRVLYRDIKAMKECDDFNYRGKDGWEEYVNDYMKVCDGLKPDHGFHYKIIYDGKALV